MIDKQRILDELSKVGIQVNCIWELVNTKEKYPAAIDVLVDLVQKDFSNNRDKEGVIRALTVKEAKGKANKALLDVYKNIREKDAACSYAWAIGNAFDVIVTQNDVDDIIPIVLDKTNGCSRQMFAHGLWKVKSERVENTLILLLDDEQVAPHALSSLGKMKSLNAKEKIISLLQHPRPLIRKEALKALKRIEKTSA